MSMLHGKMILPLLLATEVSFLQQVTIRSFGTPINLSNTARGSFFPQIAAIGSNVYVTWVDATPGNNDIFVINNAQPFATPVNISNNPGNSLIPQIATT
jgi:hypothetical protein